jgi:hypothetical protein
VTFIRQLWSLVSFIPNKIIRLGDLELFFPTQKLYDSTINSSFKQIFVSEIIPRPKWIYPLTTFSLFFFIFSPLIHRESNHSLPILDPFFSSLVYSGSEYLCFYGNSLTWGPALRLKDFGSTVWALNWLQRALGSFGATRIGSSRTGRAEVSWNIFKTQTSVKCHHSGKAGWGLLHSKNLTKWC